MTEKVPIREDIFNITNDQWELVANQCKSCGQIFFPKTKRFCLNCHHEDVQDIKLNTKGTLFTFTTVEMPVSNFSPPFTVGYLELDEKVRIFGQIKKDDNQDLEIGMPMEIEISTLWNKDGKDVVGFRFIPCAE